jgi:hypothetical protein
MRIATEEEAMSKRLNDNHQIFLKGAYMPDELLKVILRGIGHTARQERKRGNHSGATGWLMIAIGIILLPIPIIGIPLMVIGIWKACK